MYSAVTDNWPDSVQWQRCTDGSLPGTLRAIAYDGEQLVAVGDNALLLTSTDGCTWVRQPISGPSLLGVASDGFTVVAVGESGSTVVQGDS